MKKSETNNISETLTSIVDFFQRHRIPYALIGAMALNIYGRPRTTLDIDFLILLDEPGFSNIKDKASTINFRIDEEWIKMKYGEEKGGTSVPSPSTSKSPTTGESGSLYRGG